MAVNPANLTILQLNDVHAYLEPHQEVFWSGHGAVYRQAGGYARIARLVDQARRENPGGVLLLDGGDTLHGTYPAVQSEGEVLVPVLNSLAFDAMTAHWEFAYGPAVLEQRAAQLHYPLLAANVYREYSSERLYPPYTVRETGGVRVGIIGLASNIVDKTMPPEFSKGVYFTLGKDELVPLIEELRGRERVDLVVLLSHLGFPQDMKLASEVAGIDVVLSSHTHNRLYSPALQGSTIVIQSGSHGSFVGRLDLEIDGGRVVDYSHRLIPTTDDVEPDPATAELVSAVTAPFSAELGQSVGSTAVALNRATSMESTMDNLLLEAVLDSSQAELAFSNGWRYGAPVVPGPVTLNDLYNIVPMNPPISTVDLTGDEVLSMIEENLERTFSRDPYKQIGGYVKRALGLRAYVRPENPEGHRVQQLFIGDKPADRRQVYRAAYVTEQGVGREYGSNRAQTGARAVEALRTCLAKHGTVRPEIRGTFVAV